MSDSDTPRSSAGDDLDPQDWDTLREHWRRFVDLGVTHLEGIRGQPVWRPIPEQTLHLLARDLPKTPVSLETLYQEFSKLCLPYGNGNTHPSFFGWVHGGGNVYGAIGEMCAAFMNSNAGGRDHVAIHIERQVLRWCRELFGYPADSSGLLTSGTSMATLIALAVARERACQPHVAKTQGLKAFPHALTGYCSQECHHSVAKAFQLLGLGEDALRVVSVDESHGIHVPSLAARIAEDREQGHVPFVVITTIGTVNTGAIDDVPAVLDLCQQEGLWVHVDAAFAGALALGKKYRHCFDQVGQADSIAFDFHKWFQVPYSVGGLLVRDAQAHMHTFGSRKDYLATESIGLAGGQPWFCDFGPELSRSSLAIKVWFTLRALGGERIGAMADRHCDFAAGLARRIEDNPDLELLAPVRTNIVCFRYLHPDEELRDAFNRALVSHLQFTGRAAPSTTRINGSLAIRIAIVNHRTRMEDLDRMVDDVITLASHLSQPSLTDLLRPTHWHLMHGGDARLLVDPATGLNRYGCAPFLREHAYTFASSTATSVSGHAYEHADIDRQKLLHAAWEADAFLDVAREHAQGLCGDIARILGIHDLAPEIRLSPSGTDSQLHVMAALATIVDRPLISLVCAADETGSGTPFSVTGRHFDATTALGAKVPKGEPLRGMPYIGFHGEPLHDATGRLRGIDEVDGAIEQKVAKLIQDGQHVVLHAMDYSKLGCWSPSRHALERLHDRFGAHMTVIVDACQLRIDQEDLRQHLAKGFIVLVTGSKFFTGPPFSGAAIFPRAFDQRLREDGRDLPAGVADYLPGADLGSWHGKLAEATNRPFNSGAYLRWRAALAEMQRYYSVPVEYRCQALDSLCAGVIEAVGRHPFLELLFLEGESYFERTQWLGRELSSRRTIIPFLIRDEAGYLAESRVKCLYELLNRDLTMMLSDQMPHKMGPEAHAIAAQACHIGQPVKIAGRNTAALRISMGARAVAEHWQGHPQGYLQSVAGELKQVEMILRKIGLCLEYRLC
ncbi:pyridoxal phosphate-dependent decarboxylase family protein [Ectothiorhodospira marina]|uniref:Glutamate or tyrosine decarboxylase n=1 Tax=Ectothiorhodospira marina TaxID=1396821 RepID=A0A1H7IBY2_9GAMM|nr:pyridoxal-dependent decarboxylase [Ectothiorhodospira marina]SEK59989.1 Glutamate or tyrosine decarboxylase [Ectothiorhodospira marina]